MPRDFCHGLLGAISEAVSPESDLSDFERRNYDELKRVYAELMASEAAETSDTREASETVAR